MGLDGALVALVLLVVVVVELKSKNVAATRPIGIFSVTSLESDCHGKTTSSPSLAVLVV
jgi:hypothetical protein